MAAAMRPMMSTTTISSTRVKPADRPRGTGRRRIEGPVAVGLLALIPVSDIRVHAFAARLVVGPQRIQVVFVVVRAGEGVEVGVVPRILAHPLQVAARLPV